MVLVNLPGRPRPAALLPPRSKGKTEAATAVIELLMMDMRMPPKHVELYLNDK